MIRTFTQYAKHRLSTYTLRTLRGGFTLAEMLTICAIITIITAVVVQNQSKFNGDLELTNVAYRIALEARQAQVYGIGVRQATGAASSFTVPYGLHFRVQDQDSIIFFRDIDSNGRYTSADDLDSECSAAASGNECIEKLQFGRGVNIYKYCGLIVGSSGQVRCESAYIAPSGGGSGGSGHGGGAQLDFFDVLFTRPKTDANFRTYTGANYATGNIGGFGICGGPCDGMAICIQSADQQKKRVVVLLQTGQISVENIGDTTAGNDNLCST